MFSPESEKGSGDSGPRAGWSPLSAAPSSDETEKGEGLLEDTGDNGTGEPSEELQAWLELAWAGDWEQWMTEGLPFSSPGGELRLACAIRFFFSRGEMTSPAAEGT